MRASADHSISEEGDSLFGIIEQHFSHPWPLHRNSVCENIFGGLRKSRRSELCCFSVSSGKRANALLAGGSSFPRLRRSRALFAEDAYVHWRIQQACIRKSCFSNRSRAHCRYSLSFSITIQHPDRRQWVGTCCTSSNNRFPHRKIDDA